MAMRPENTDPGQKPEGEKDSAFLFLKALVTPDKKVESSGKSEETLGVPEKDAAQAEQPAEQAPELSAEEKERQEKLQQYEGEYRAEIKKRIESGKTPSEVESDLFYQQTRISTTPEEKQLFGARARDIYERRSQVLYKVLEEFEPAGSGIKSYVETATVNRGGHVIVAFNPKHEQYEIYPEGGYINPYETEEGKYVPVATIPEIAKMLFEHAVKKGEEKEGGFYAEDFIKEAASYREEIRDGKGLDAANAEKAVENWDAMFRRMKKLREIARRNAEKFGTEVPQEIEAVVVAKRTQIIEEWKHQLAELQKKDQIDKIKNSIADI